METAQGQTDMHGCDNSEMVCVEALCNNAKPMSVIRGGGEGVCLQKYPTPETLDSPKDSM